MELQPQNAEHNRVVAKLGDKHRQGLLMFEYCEVGVGNMRDVAAGYRAAVDDLKASGILEGCKWGLVMACEVFVYESDSCSSAVNEGMGGNSPVAEGDTA